jgi:hypothetical protein
MVSFLPGPPSQLRSYGDLLQNFRLANFFPLTDELSLNVGGSSMFAPNSVATGTRTYITGGDIYLKYRPEDSLKFIALQAEILGRRYDQLSGRQSDWGFYSQTSYRFAQRWITGLRYDWYSAQRTPDGAVTDAGGRWRLSPVLTFYPSEFSKLRFQVNYDRPQQLGNQPQWAAFAQFEFLMGAHGAHKF